MFNTLNLWYNYKVGNIFEMLYYKWKSSSIELDKINYDKAMLPNR